jgi:hypothetical protein
MPQVVDFPAAIACAADLTKARRLLTAALLDVAEAAFEAWPAAKQCRISMQQIPKWILRNRLVQYVICVQMG